MNITRRLTRKWLIQSTRTEFYKALDEYKVTPFQRLILVERFIHDKSNILISIENHVSLETVRTEMAKAYDHLKGVIL